MCIVQDEREEWLAQAREMGSIYANATLTIALHQPRSSTEGFLWRMRVPDWLEISTRSARMKRLPSFWLQLPTVIDDFDTWEVMKSSQIIGRGWCFQELWLSPRSLHVIEDKFIWRCPHSPTTKDTTGFIERGSIPSDDDSEASSAGWRRLVRRYSICDLTVPGDRLPALSGIHSLWPTMHTRGSHCGHLGINLHTGLLWHKNSLNHSQSVTRMFGRAPS